MSILLERSARGLIKQYQAAVQNHGDWVPAAASRLGIEASLLYAILVMEVGGRPTTTGRRIKKLFMISGHFTPKYKKKHPGSPLPGWANARMSGKWSILDQAISLDADLAYRNTSWGPGQVHGWSYRKLGYSSPAEMVKAFMRSASAQQQGMVDFIRTKRSLLNALKNKDWWLIGRTYNGDKRGKYARNLQLMYNSANPNNQDNSAIASTRREYLKTRGQGGAAQPGVSGGRIVLIGDSNAARINQQYKSYYESRGASVLALHWNGSGASQWIDVLTRVAQGGARRNLAELSVKSVNAAAAQILRHGITQIHCTSLGGNDGGAAYKDSTLKAYIDRKIKPLMQLMAKYPGSTFAGPVPIGSERTYKGVNSNTLRAKMSKAMEGAAKEVGIAYWNPHGAYSYDPAALDKRKDDVHITSRMAKQEFQAREGFLSGQAASSSGASAAAIAQSDDQRKEMEQRALEKDMSDVLKNLAKHKDAIAAAGPPSMAQVKQAMAKAKEEQNAPEPEDFGDDETPVDVPGQKGRIMKKYVNFLKKHQPDFNFDKFYSELDSYLKSANKKDVLANRDYVFGDEHYDAFVLLRDLKDREANRAVSESFVSLKRLIQEVRTKW